MRTRRLPFYELRRFGYATPTRMRPAYAFQIAPLPPASKAPYRFIWTPRTQQGGRRCVCEVRCPPPPLHPAARPSLAAFELAPAPSGSPSALLQHHLESRRLEVEVGDRQAVLQEA